MAVQFEDRERAREAKFAHDEEMAFKADIRRNRLVGQWLAEQMGLSGSEAAEYAHALSQSETSLKSPDAFLEHMLQEAQAKNLDISEHMLRKQMDDCLAEARRQIMNETSD